MITVHEHEMNHKHILKIILKPRLKISHLELNNIELYKEHKETKFKYL